MARLNKDTAKIEDFFFDLDPAKQAELLATLQTLHRLKQRQESERTSKAAPDRTPGSAAILGEPE